MVSYTIKVYWDKMESEEIIERFATLKDVQKYVHQIASAGLEVEGEDRGLFIPPSNITHISYEESKEEMECPPAPNYWPWIIAGNIILWIMFLWVWIKNG